jgi:hypothetical protein
MHSCPDLPLGESSKQIWRTSWTTAQMSAILPKADTLSICEILKKKKT